MHPRCEPAFCTLHQIAPYIGRLRIGFARELVVNLSKPGDTIIDPFAGAGTVALEALCNGRAVIAGDWNAYAGVLTRAKLFAPSSVEAADDAIEKTWALSRRLLSRQDLRRVPSWVRNFFHPTTLKSALAFRDACLEYRDDFLLACLLGILHHERPGFLSYPSSHLVPYLRDRKYPRALYPELYAQRDVKSRVAAKVRRMLQVLPPSLKLRRSVLLKDARRFPKIPRVRAIITSPPYMNELDYVRDNRLRLWFIDKRIPAHLECSSLRKEIAFAELITTVFSRLAPCVVDGGYIALVLGDTRRGMRRLDTAQIARRAFDTIPQLRKFKLKAKLSTRIPDVRRSRRAHEGTKQETVLVFQRD